MQNRSMNHLETAADSSHVKILVVDDHPSTATTLARALAQLGPQIEVLSATSGQEALDQVKNWSADILITAYDVPGLNVTARRLKVKEVIVKPVHPERIRQVVLEAMDEMVESKPTGN